MRTLLAAFITFVSSIAMAIGFPTTANVVTLQLSSADNQIIMFDGYARLSAFDAATGHLTSQTSFKSFQGSPYSATLSASGKLVASINENPYGTESVVSVYDAATGGLLKSLSLSRGKRVRFISDDEVAVAFDPSVASQPLGVQILNWRLGTTLGKLQWDDLAWSGDHFDKLSVSPDGKYLALGRTTDQAVRIWNLKTMQTAIQVSPPKGYGGADIAFLGNDRVAIAFSSFLDPGSRTSITVHDLLKLKPEERMSFSTAHGIPSGLVSSTDGKRLAIYDSGAWAVRVIDLKAQATFLDHRQGRMRLCSPRVHRHRRLVGLLHNRRCGIVRGSLIKNPCHGRLAKYVSRAQPDPDPVLLRQYEEHRGR